MPFDRFVVESARYDFDCPTKGVLWFYTLGLCGEVAEVVEKLRAPVLASAVAKELGDVLWYVAALSRELGVGELDAYEQTNFNWASCDYADAMVIEAGRVAERVKKHYRDGAELDKETMRTLLSQVVYRVHCIATRYNLTLGEVAAMNIEKLESRRLRGTSRGSGDDR